MKEVNIYAATSYRSPRRADGWIGYVLETEGRTGPVTLTGFEKLQQSTRYQAELLSVIKALEHMTTQCRITVYTDSVYVAAGFRDWAQVWKQSGWLTARGDPIANREEWKRLVELTDCHEITVRTDNHTYSGWLAGELARRSCTGATGKERNNG